MIFCRIQHHVSRADLLPKLIADLAPLPVQVIADNGPPPPSPWRGYQLCLQEIPECSHLLILQDDVRVCHNFTPALERIAQAKPDNPIVLFLGGLPRRTAMDALRATKRHERYVKMFIRDFVPVVAVLWPREKALHFLEWSKTAKLPGYSRPRSDDAIAGRWMLATRQTIYATLPSLVEHLDEVPSTIGKRAAYGRDRGRVALQFIGEQNPLELF